MVRLAVIILTKNEENNIEECIQSASFADEIVIIDSGSTDATQAKAEALGARFVVHPMGDDGFAGQRNFALTQTEAEWVFFLDADERILSETSFEIRNVINEDRNVVYRIKRMNILFGKLMRHGAHAPDWCIRLFPRKEVCWKGKVHEHPEFKLTCLDLKGCMHHYTYKDWGRYFYKLGQYTDMMADKMHQRGKKADLVDLILRPSYAFIRAYFFKLGFLDGELGFIFSVLHGYYTFMKYLKLRYIYSSKELIK